MIRINLVEPKLINSDCLEALRQMPDNSIDSIVTDPPYGISFMGKKWDYQVPSVETFQEMLRVLKPGGHMLCACGTRTQHRMAVNIEDAGFEIRDVVSWIYGSGFPKSMDISKAIDKQFGAEREIVGDAKRSGSSSRAFQSEDQSTAGIHYETAPATKESKQWQGWGTALKPACEFWTLARKPLSEKTVASNVLKHGTGGINIDGSRIEGSFESGWSKSGSKESENLSMSGKNYERAPRPDNPQGRWPANVMFDEEAAKVLDEQTEGTRASKPSKIGKKSVSKSSIWSKGDGGEFSLSSGYFDDGGNGVNASRFFYVAKASKSERNHGLDGLEVHRYGKGLGEGKDPLAPTIDKNFHPTVKPIKLMQYLVKMITPPNGIVLDPFMGSGSTGVAAVKEGFGFVGIEREESYFEICKARIEGA